MHAATTNLTDRSANPGSGPPTRPERQALLRALLTGRGLERVLARHGRTRDGAGSEEAVLTAIAAASALDPRDRLLLPHCLLAARLATGADLATLAAARRGVRGGATAAAAPGVGPQAPAPLAVGVAFALRRADSHSAAVAIVEQRWAEADECRGALALARELGLPLVVVAVETVAGAPREPTAVDSRDFEAVRSAVHAAIAGAHADRGPALVFCSPAKRDAPAHRPFRTEADDPVAAYERWLMINGFSRADLDAVRHQAAAELAGAFGSGLGGAAL